MFWLVLHNFQAHFADRVAQRFAAARIGQQSLAAVCGNGEKISGAGNVGASVFWHVGILA
ncbi:MAG: hypothetical protein HY935_01880 [Nitrosomonadales bacterium]|nr:hypothetical protein [Nitrosomonadales bacterium]